MDYLSYKTKEDCLKINRFYTQFVNLHVKRYTSDTYTKKLCQICAVARHR